MNESFDAVLAEMGDFAEDSMLGRLASAHEAEVAERDAIAEGYRASRNAYEQEAVQLQARADRAVGLLRDYRMAPKFSHDHAAIKRTVELEDEIDAFLSEQAGERENGDG